MKFYVVFTMEQVEYVREGDAYLPTTTIVDRMPHGHGYFYRVHSSRIQNSPRSLLPRFDVPCFSMVFPGFQVSAKSCLEESRVNRNILHFPLSFSIFSFKKITTSKARSRKRRKSRPVHESVHCVLRFSFSIQIHTTMGPLWRSFGLWEGIHEEKADNTAPDDTYARVRTPRHRD